MPAERSGLTRNDAGSRSSTSFSRLGVSVPRSAMTGLPSKARCIVGTSGRNSSSIRTTSARHSGVLSRSQVTMSIPSRSSWRLTIDRSRSSLMATRALRPRRENEDGLLISRSAGEAHSATIRPSKGGRRRRVATGKDPALRARQLPRRCQTVLARSTPQPWRKDAVIVVAVDPDRPLRRIVAIAGGSAPPLGNVGCAGPLQCARKQMDRDVGGLPIDGGTAGVTVTRLPALHESAVVGQAEALEKGAARDTAGGCLSDDLEFRFTKTATQHRNVEAGGRGSGMKGANEIVA